MWEVGVKFIYLTSLNCNMAEDLDQKILGTEGEAREEVHEERNANFEKPSWIQLLPVIGLVKWRNDLYDGRPAIGRDKWVLDETTGRYVVRDSLSIKSIAWGIYQSSIMSASVIIPIAYVGYLINN